jgi:predicted SnoaL-like aldol condensation-catalyzing enzyme
VDINPAMLPVAWARLARSDLLGRLCDRLIRARPNDFFDAEVEIGDADLLTVYFADRPASLLRSLRNHLVYASAEVAHGFDSHEMRAISGVAFVMFAEVIREALRPMRGTNPSWFSRPKTGQRRISADGTDIANMLRKAATAMSAVADTGHGQRLAQHKWPELVLGDSRQELTSLGTFDLIISSPPYCTRIDYAVATTPELLALGGLGDSEFSALRRQIIGSVVTDKAEPSSDVSRSPTLRRTLEAIRQHHTKAASTYYARYFTKYFNDLALSLHQLVRAARGGHIVLVVQGSYFKEVEIDLRTIVTELMEEDGLVLSEAWKHPARSPIAGSNPRFRIYRESNVATEDILVFSTH